ncbi:hypothetical protein HDU86_004472 [Geranomyces michiganensis]|nr:hypothetical protein HDU86_004472 [Geranomyces michiganensis]
MEHSQLAPSGTINSSIHPPQNPHRQEHSQQQQEHHQQAQLIAPQPAHAVTSVNPTASAPNPRQSPFIVRQECGTGLAEPAHPDHTAYKPQRLPDAPDMGVRIDHDAIRAALAAAISAEKARSPQIYSAVYSGVPVYEMVCKNTPVMRRMADGYMNATQILKVAGFTKAKRTKILEREILPGPHEKIQGGYGKYQGTWIPTAISRALAARYNIENQLQPLFDFDPLTRVAGSRPPDMQSLAPKRPPESGGLRSADSERPLLTPNNAPSSGGTTLYAAEWESAAGQLLDNLSTATVADGSQISAPEISTEVQTLLQSQDVQQYLAQTATAASETGHPSTDPAPMQVAYQQLALLNLLNMAAQHAYSAGYPSPEDLLSANKTDDGSASFPTMGDGLDSQFYQPPSGSLKHRLLSDAQTSGDRQREAVQDTDEQYQLRIRQQNVITNMFLFGDRHIYQIIDSMKPAADAKKPDPNMVVDSVGSSLLHHAAQLGRAPLVAALIQNGANPAATANGGETALMRSVLYTDCYRLCSFEEVVRLLVNTVYLADNNRRTVFHHAARAARNRDHWAAGGYYVRILADALVDQYAEAPELMPRVINLQDSHGNTALHYACRSGNRNVVRTILRLGADPEIKNQSGDAAVDVARFQPRLLALLFPATDINRRLRMSTGVKDRIVGDQDFYASPTDTGDEDGWITDFSCADGEDTEVDDLERSPSPDHPEKSIHHQTMKTLDGYYGERTASIMHNLIPDAQAARGTPRREIQQLRKTLAPKSTANADVSLKARQKLEYAKEAFSDLFEQRTAMFSLSTLAVRIDGVNETRKVGDGPGTRRRHSASQQFSLPGKQENGDIAGPNAGIEARGMAIASMPASAAPASHPTINTAAPLTSAVQSDLKRKRSVTPETVNRRASSNSLPNAVSAYMRTSNPISDPSSPARLHTRSNRTYSTRLKTQLADLRARLSASDRDRMELAHEIDRVRADREFKDCKFKHLVARCMKVDVSQIEGLVGPLVKTETKAA